MRHTRNPGATTEVLSAASAVACVATRYLANYLGWWRMIDRMGQTLTPLTCIAAALPQAST